MEKTATPSRGGRTRGAASTAHTSAAAGSRSSATSPAASSVAPSRRKPHGATITTSASHAAIVRPADADRRRRRGVPSTGVAAGRGDEVGHPVAGRERRIGPLQHQRASARRAVHGGRDRGQLLAAARRRWPPPGRSCPVAAPTVRTDSRTSSSVDGIERQHGGPAPEPLQGVVDLADVDGAHGAQVLGDHQRRVEVGEGAPIEVVEVLAGGHPLLDHGVDLGRRQALRAAPRSTRSACRARRPGSRTRTSPRRPRRRARARTGSRWPTAAGRRSARRIWSLDSPGLPATQNRSGPRRLSPSVPLMARATG